MHSSQPGINVRITVPIFIKPTKSMAISCSLRMANSMATVPQETGTVPVSRERLIVEFSFDMDKKSLGRILPI
jgi:hypothetical protein